MDDDDDEPAKLTRGELRRLMNMAEEWERRQWIIDLIGKTAKWIGVVGAAVALVSLNLRSFLAWVRG